jgi:hypothetical protein
MAYRGEGGNYPPKASGHPAVKLADKVLGALAGADTREAIDALQIALRLLPVKSSRVPG